MILIQCKLRLVLVYILKQGIDDKKKQHVYLHKRALKLHI